MEGSFIKGVEQGIWKEYNELGILISEGNYIDGKKEGKWKEYSDGKLLKSKLFKNGIEVN